MTSRPLRVLTWHIHGNYLYYLSQTPCHFLLPVKEGKPQGYSGRSGRFPWGDNVEEIPAEKVKDADIDCIIYQSRQNYLEDQYEILTQAQRLLPRIYIEHDPPREVPTDTKHVVDDPNVLLVHVTHFNRLMWDNNRSPTKVITHGVLVPDDARYTGRHEKGIVVVNNIATRGRRLGLDVFKEMSRHVPLDIVGMGSEQVGGLGEVPQPDLPKFISEYRFMFNPIRYTSLGLAVCEAMTVGLPVVGLATTEMPVVIRNGESGYLHTDPDFLIDKMNLLLSDAEHARSLGQGAATVAREAFSIQRFAAQWRETIEEAVFMAAETPRRIEGARR